MDSFEVERLLLCRGFVVVDERTHAVGLSHPDVPGQMVYLKDGRSRLSDPRKPVGTRPLVLHPDAAKPAGFMSTRVAGLEPDMLYMNSSMSQFPLRGTTKSGIAVDVPDEGALDEVLCFLGLVEPESSPPDEDIVAAIDLPIDDTERRAVIAARRGQGRFRKDVLRAWGVCAVTGCTDPALLRASHIKPWRDSTNSERLSAYNGLLLAPHLDAAFDRGYISFSDNGEILINDRRIGSKDAASLGIHADMRLRIVPPGYLPFLAVHRKLHGFT